MVDRTLDQLQLPGVASAAATPAIETSVIYRDDNLRRLNILPAESIDLIYLDPPFFSNRQYEVIWGDEAEVRSFEDRWEGGINHYIEWMRERVVDMYRLLKPTGSMYLHCDANASHYLKVMMDGVFGQTHFVNEITWQRTSAHSDAAQGARHYGRIADTLLFYAKGDEYAWHPAWTSHTEAYMERQYRHVDPTTGRRYGLFDVTGPGGEAKGNPHYEILGVTRFWRYTKAKMQSKIDAGRVIQTKPGTVPREIRYLDESAGRPVGTIWTDIPPIQSHAKERLGYPTQKPEALLERIIQVSTNEGDIVLDPFCGCGTTLVVAERLKRRWIGIDISPTACNMMYRRLVKIRANAVKLIGMPTTEEQLLTLKPFEFQNWIIDRINGIQATRRSGDMGIDGWTFMLKDPVQIKQSESVGRNVVDNFETAIKRANHKRGFVIAFSFTKGAREEVSRVRRDGLDIHLLTVQDLLERPDWVMVQMGIASGLPQLSLAPMPQIDPRRHSAAELIASDARQA
ncbi:MAG: DNA methyltransferase [Candidatus Dormibacteraceae bacterium]